MTWIEQHAVCANSGDQHVVAAIRSQLVADATSGDQNRVASPALEVFARGVSDQHVAEKRAAQLVDVDKHITFSGATEAEPVLPIDEHRCWRIRVDSAIAERPTGERR